MNIHEYQAKELLEKFGVATSPGKAARTPAEAERVARELATTAEIDKCPKHPQASQQATWL